MSFASGRFADRRDPGPACREAAGAARHSLSREAAEARGQPRPKEIAIIVSAVIARSARARGAIEDRSLVILAVPLCPPGMSQAFISQDFRFGLLASIKNNTSGAVYLIYFYPEGLQRPTNGALKEAFPVWHERSMGFEWPLAAVRAVEARFGRRNGAAKTDLGGRIGIAGR